MKGMVFVGIGLISAILANTTGDGVMAVFATLFFLVGFPLLFDRR